MSVGDPVEWTYLVTNTGNESIANVTVTDDQLVVDPAPVVGLGGFNIGDTNPQNDLLEPSETWVFTANGTAVAGQYENLGTANGTGSVSGTDLEAEDPDYYFGLAPVLVIAKDFSNPGNDGPPTNDLPEETVTAGGSPGTFYITVTNTGNDTADNVTITDLVPAVLTVSNVTGTAGFEVANPALDDNNISWLVTSLAPNASVTLTVTYSVAAGVDCPVGEQHGHGGQRRGRLR